MSRARRKKEKVYRSFAWQKPLSAKKTDLKSAVQLGVESYDFLRLAWRPFAILTGFFFCLALVLLFSNGANSGLESAKAEFSQRYGGGFSGELSTALAMLSEASQRFDQSADSVVRLVRGTESFCQFVCFVADS